MPGKRTFRIAFFIDGYTLKKVNEYYRLYHPYHSTLDFVGLRNWSRREAVRVFGFDPVRTVVDSHYYHPYKDPRLRGAFSTGMRGFERELRFGGYQIHYSRFVDDDSYGVNMDLVSDALLYASYGKMDAVVLLTTQGQYSVLPDRLKMMGIPTLLLGWNFSYVERDQRIRWRTDVELRDMSTYYVAMEKVAARNPPPPEGVCSLFRSAEPLPKAAKKPFPFLKLPDTSDMYVKTRAG